MFTSFASSTSLFWYLQVLCYILSGACGIAFWIKLLWNEYSDRPPLGWDHVIRGSFGMGVFLIMGLRCKAIQDVLLAQ